MSRDGTPKQQGPGIPLDSSIYADCFVVLGLAGYAVVGQDRSALDFALRLYRSITARFETGTFNSEPYPMPAGYKPHGVPMILLNTSQELAEALKSLQMFEAGDIIEQAANGYLRQVMSFIDSNGALHEYISSDGKIVTDNLLGRHVNPGHTIEDMWFVMHQALRSPDAAFARATNEWAGQAIKRAFQIGWDNEFGGLLHFVDQDGGAPTGSIAGMEDVRVVQQVVNGWGDKLWWVHSEALYATLLAYRLTGDAAQLPLYRQAFDYTFRTFPNPDPAIGEWIQIRDRQGVPQQKVVALPVKDPYHILRNMLLIIDLLTNWQEYGK
jgi:N-acylglucosamine 2-epimerase